MVNEVLHVKQTKREAFDCDELIALRDKAIALANIAPDIYWQGTYQQLALAANALHALIVQGLCFQTNTPNIYDSEKLDEIEQIINEEVEDRSIKHHF